MPATERVEIIVEVKDRATKPIGDVTKAIEGLGQVLSGVAILAAGQKILDFYERVFTTIKDVAIEVGKAALEAVSDYERLGIMLQMLSASEEMAAGRAETFAEGLELSGARAQELLVWVRELAIASPYSMEAIGSGLRMAMIYGANADQAQRLTQALVDFASASGLTNNELYRLALAFSQVIGRGKLMGMEMRQFANAGLGVSLIAQAMGIEISKVDEAMRAGAITADELVEGFIRLSDERFAGSAERASRAWFGLTETLGDIARLGLVKLFGEFNAETGEMAGILGELQPVVQAFVSAVSDPAFMESLGSLGTLLGQGIAPAMHDLAIIVPRVVELVRQLSDAVAESLEPFHTLWFILRMLEVPLSVIAGWMKILGIGEIEAADAAAIWRSELQQIEPALRAGSALHRDLAAAIDEVASAWRSVEMPSDSELTAIARAQWRYAMTIRDTAGQIRLVEDRLRDVKRGTQEWWDLQYQLYVLNKELMAGIARDAESSAKSASTSWKGYWDDVRNAIEQVLKATSVTAEDVLATALGVYEEKWDEAARRLDVVVRDILEKGFGTEYLELVPPEVLAQGSEAIKLWAMRTAKDIRELLRPELIDWDAFRAAFTEFMQNKELREATIQRAFVELRGVGMEVPRDLIEEFFGIEPDLAGATSRAAGAMEEVAALSGPVATATDNFALLNTAASKATSELDPLAIALGLMTGEIEDTAEAQAAYTKAIKKAMKDLITPPLAEPPPPVEISPSGVIPSLQFGGRLMRSAFALVGERGPEIVRLPGGSSVYSSEQTTRILEKGPHVVFGPGSIVIQGGSRAEVTSGVLAALRAAGMPL